MIWDEVEIKHAVARLALALSSGHHNLDEDDEQFVEDMVELDAEEMSPSQIQRLHDISQTYEEWAEENDPDG